MNESQEEMWDKWLTAWDNAQAGFAKDAENTLRQSNLIPPQDQPQSSWLTGSPMDRDYEQKDDFAADLDWNTIYQRSQNLHGLITDGVQYDKGETTPKATWGAPTPTKTNPTKQDTVGPDAGYGPVRVTDNWSDGADLRELDDIKRRIEEMERKHHTAEVTNGSSSLKKQLEGLRDQINKLSEKINRMPTTDVT